MKRGAVTRRQALAHVLAEPRRRALVAYATSRGADAAAAERVVDDAVVAAFGAGVPGDLVMADTLVRVEIARRASHAAPSSTSSGRTPSADASPERRGAVIARRIRRRRARRILGIGGAATLAVALTVGAAVAVTRIERTPAAGAPEQPGPVPAGSSETPTPDGPQPLGDVTEHSLLPAAEPLLEGMLEAAGPGWSLVQYVSAALDGGSLVYLVDPEGGLYEVPGSENLPGRLQDWLPGSTLALFETGRHVRESVVVDLVTGQQYVTLHEVLADDRGAYSAGVAFVGDGTTDLIARWADWTDDGRYREIVRTVRVGLDGGERASAPVFAEPVGVMSATALSPDGSRMAVSDRAGLRVVATDGFADVGAIDAPYRDGDSCGVDAWFTEDLITLECSSTGQGVDEVWLAPADGGEPTLLGGSVRWPQVWLVGGATVIRGHDDDGNALVLRTDGDLEPLDVELPWAVSGSAGGRVIGHTPQYEARYWDDELVSIDPLSGDRRALLTSNHEHSAITSVVTINDSGRASRGEY